MTIKEIIIKKREDSGMTQAELSKRTGIPQHRISDFELGKRSMTSRNIDRIFAELNIKFEQTKEQLWTFAEECAKILKEKGIEKIDRLNQEEVANLTGKEEILSMRNYDSAYIESPSPLIKEIDVNSSWNYMEILIKLHLALLK